MKSLLLFLFATLFVSLICANSVSLSIERVVDLTTQFVKQEVYYEIVNSNNSPLSSMEVAIKEENLSHWSIFKVTDKRGIDQQVIEEKLEKIESKITRSTTHNGVK